MGNAQPTHAKKGKNHLSMKANAATSNKSDYIKCFDDEDEEKKIEENNKPKTLFSKSETTMLINNNNQYNDEDNNSIKPVRLYSSTMSAIPPNPEQLPPKTSFKSYPMKRYKSYKHRSKNINVMDINDNDIDNLVKIAALISISPSIEETKFIEAGNNWWISTSYDSDLKVNL